MKSQCDVCITEDCKGTDREFECDCESCGRRSECLKFIRPTIRITLKCTQTCEHCCFDCSPEQDAMMSVEVAQKIAIFLKTNNIEGVNMMGGEFYLNPDWKEILRIFAESVDTIRLVTNADWVRDCPGIIEEIQRYPDLYLAISNDEWHTNEYVGEAVSLCKEKGVIYSLAEDITEATLVPVGRANLTSWGLHASFGQYCSHPDKMYSILINEKGDIAKCPMGAWELGNVADFPTRESFSEKFKHFNQKFREIFVPNCRACYQAWKRGG